MQYYIVPKTTATKYQGFQKDNFQINFSQLNTGEWAINVGCGEEIFTEIDFTKFKKRELENTDFNPYYSKPKVNGYNLIGVFDNYNSTATIYLFKDGSETQLTLNYVDTWSDSDVNNAINNL